MSLNLIDTIDKIGIFKMLGHMIRFTFKVVFMFELQQVTTQEILPISATGGKKNAKGLPFMFRFGEPNGSTTDDRRYGCETEQWSPAGKNMDTD